MPYFFRTLFSLFGASLSLIYIVNGLITLIMVFMLYFIARQLLEIKDAFIYSILFIVVCAFFPTLKDYILPYAGSAVYGNLFSIATLTCLVAHYKFKKNHLLYLAPIFAGVACIIKHEYAVSACGILIIYLAYLSTINKKYLKELILPLIILFSIPFFTYSLLANIIGYNEVIKIILPFDTLKSIDSFQYEFIKGGITLESIKYGFIYLIAYLVITSAVLYVIYNMKIQRVKTSLPVIIILAIMIALVYVFINNFVYFSFRFFAGLNIIVFVTAILAYKAYFRKSNNELLLLICIYSLLINLRAPFYTGFEGYASYYLPTSFIIMVFLLAKALPEISFMNLNSDILKFSTSVYLTLIILYYALLGVNFYSGKNIFLTFNNNDVLALPDTFAYQYQEIIDYIKQNTSKDENIFIIPEEISYYILSRRFSPGKYYYLNPIMFNNNEKNQNELMEIFKDKPPKYILISNIPLGEFGVESFGKDYCVPIYKWIQINYNRIKTVETKLKISETTYYTVEIYSLKKQG